MAIVKTIKFLGKPYGLTGLMTFDEVANVDELFDPDKMTFSERLKSAKSMQDKLDLAKEARSVTIPQRKFVAQMIDKYIQMPPADRKAMGFVDGWVLFQLLYQTSTEVPENLELPSAATSTSDSTQQKTSPTFHGE